MKAIKFANFEAIAKFTGRKILGTNTHLLFLRIIILTSLILAISGTTLIYLGKTTSVSYVIAIDASSSMITNDLEPSRIEVAKSATTSFIDKLPFNTKVGIITFAGTTFIKQRPTIDKLKLKETIKTISTESAGGTAIGEAIITSSNLLSEEKGSKSIILISDGQNNIGTSVENALNYVDKENIKIHTIGIATEESNQETNIPVISKLDEERLKNIAESTNGRFFKITSQESIKEAFSLILDIKKEKVILDISVYLMLYGLILVFLEWGLQNTKYRTLP